MVDRKTFTNRRKFLQVAGATAVTTSAALAGCLGDDGAGDSDGSEDSADSFPSGDIQIIVGSSAGGGFDAYARAVAEYLPDYLEGEPNVVVENRPPDRTGAAEIYRADPDGHTFGLWNVPGQLASQLVDEPPYDIEEVTWLARVGQETYSYAVNADDPAYTSLEELQEADNVTLGVTGVFGTAHIVGAISAAVLDIDVTIVPHDGASDAIASLLRGDIDVFPGHSTIGSNLSDGELDVLFTLDSEHPPYIPEDVPLAEDIGYPELADTVQMHRSFGAPPGLDDEIAGILEDALLETFESDEMAAWSDDSGRPIVPATGEDAREVILSTGDLLEDYTDVLEEQAAME